MKYLILILLLTGCVTTETVEKQNDPVCQGTKMFGWAKPEDMDRVDMWTYANAKEECRINHKENPCLKELHKTIRQDGGTHYFALCGLPKGVK